VSLFSTCTNLQTANLGFNNLGAFSPKQLNKWVKAISGNRSVTELDLQSNNLGADGVKTVANALRLCVSLKKLNLSRNQPGGRPEALLQLVKEHAHLESLAVIEDDEKHLTSKAKTMLGEAMRANPQHKLAFVSCDAFTLDPTTKTLKWTSTLAADVSLLAGALRSNSTLTTLLFDGATIAEAERTQLGKALLENTDGNVGFCDDFDLSPTTTELSWDLKESSKARKGVLLLMALLRANKSLQRVTLMGLGAEPIPKLAQALHTNHTLKELVLEHTVQGPKEKTTYSITLPVQALTGATKEAEIDLSKAGELSKTSVLVLGALLANNRSVTSLRLSGTKLGDEAGSLLPVLDEQCKSGTLTTLDLSDIGLGDRGAAKLFDTIMRGEYAMLKNLVLARNNLKDLKVNGLVDMLRAEDCPLTKFDVSSNPLNGSMILRALKFNMSLTYLNLCSTELDDAGVRDFGTLLLSPDCKCPIRALSCDFFEVREETTSISFAGKGAVSSSILTLLSGILKLNEHITSLDLAGIGMDTDAAKALEVALGVNTTLKSLDLRDNPKLYQVSESGEVKAEGLEAVARGLLASSSVETIRVDAFVLHSRVLKGSEPVNELSYATSKDVSNVSAALLGALLEHNDATKSLDMSSVKNAPRLGHALGRCLGGNVSLTSVLVHDALLKDEGVSALAEGLRQNGGSTVAVLDLASNGIGAAGAAELAALLGTSKSLLKLDLTSNKIGSSGCEALVTSLKENSTLTALSLRDNDIEVAGAKAMASALRANGALSTLWLGKNKLQDDGVVALVDALLAAKDGSKVANLDLHKTGMTKTGITKLNDLVSESPSLAALALVGVKLQFTETEVLQKLAKERPEIGRAKPVRLWMGTDLNKWPDF